MPSIHTHTPGLFWGLELKVLCDITNRLWSVLSRCPPSLLASFSTLASLAPQLSDQPQTPATIAPHPSPRVYLRFSCFQVWGLWSEAFWKVSEVDQSCEGWPSRGQLLSGCVVPECEVL